MAHNAWTETSLGRLISLEYGASLRETQRTGSGYPVFGSNGEVGRHSSYLVEGPGIIVGRKGSVGEVTWSEKAFWPIDTTYYVRTIDDCDLRWCFWMLQSLCLPRLDSSTGVPGLNRNDAYRMSIKKPSFSEQRAIAEVLDTADEAIAKTEALIAKLKAIKQGLLHDLLTRGLDDNGELRDPERHPEQFTDTSLGRFPTAWDTLTINDLAVHVGSGMTPTGGSNVYKHEGVLFIRSQNVAFEGLLLDDVAYIDQQTHRMMSRSEIFAHDVLLNITGASIGRCCPVPEDLGPANVNQHVCAIRTAVPCREDAVVLSSMLASFIGQHQIDCLNAGSNRQGLNYRQLRSFVIPWPRDDAEREAMAARIESAEARLRAEDAYLSKLKAIKKGLMQDLLTGRVRVKEGLKA